MADLMPRDPAELVCRRLGLTADPFASDGLGDFFFVGGQRRFLVQQAVHQLYFGGGLVLVIGADGSGKSRLLIETERELGAVADICLTTATVMTDGDALRRDIATTVGLGAAAAADNAALVEAIEQLRPSVTEPQPVILLVDDAHVMAPATLDACADLVRAAGGRIRVLLAGEAAVLAGWTQPVRISEGLLSQIDLEPLDDQETVDYLRTRLQVAGLRAPLPLTPAAQRQLYRESSGNLAAIQIVGARLLADSLEPPIESAGPGRRAAMPRRNWVIAAGIAVAIAGIAAWPVSDGGNAESNVLSHQDSASAGQERRRVPLVLDWNGTDSVSSPAGSARGAQEAQALAVGTDQAGSSTSRRDEPADASDPAPAEVLALEPARRNIATPDAASVPKAALTSEAVPPPKVVPTAETAPIRRVAGSPAAADEERLLALAPDAYMLQLMGARSLASLQASVQRSAFPGPVYYFQTQLNGKPWFVAVTGPYREGDDSGRAAASGAVDSLPSALRAAKPWPRSIRSIQEDIRRARSSG